jgi:ACS family tartrate transporter-like MFS transporter
MANREARKNGHRGAGTPDDAKRLLASCSPRDSFRMPAAFALTTVGLRGMKSLFGPCPSTVLSGPTLAAGLAAMNSIADVSFCLGPIAAVYPKPAIGGVEAGIHVLAPASLVATLAAPGRTSRMRAPRAQVSQLILG